MIVFIDPMGRIPGRIALCRILHWQSMLALRPAWGFLSLLLGKDLLEEHIPSCCARVLQGQGTGSFSFQDLLCDTSGKCSVFLLWPENAKFLSCGAKAAGLLQPPVPGWG